MELFYILVVMVVTQVYTFVKFFHMYTLKWVHIIVSKSYLNKVGLEKEKKLHNSTCYDEPTCVKQKITYIYIMYAKKTFRKIHKKLTSD